MGRKGAKKQRQLSRDEFNYQRDYTDEQRGERREAKDRLIPEYQKLYDESFGYRPEGFKSQLFTQKQRGNILSSSVRSARIPYEGASSQAETRLARTRNSAGYGALQGELARGKSRSIADITRRVETDLTTAESQEEFRRMDWLENERYRRRTGGLEGLARMFGIDTQLLGSQMGGANRALGSHAAGIEPGKWETVANPIIGGASSAVGAYYGARG